MQQTDHAARPPASRTECSHRRHTQHAGKPPTALLVPMKKDVFDDRGDGSRSCSASTPCSRQRRLSGWFGPRPEASATKKKFHSRWACLSVLLLQGIYCTSYTISPRQRPGSQGPVWTRLGTRFESASRTHLGLVSSRRRPGRARVVVLAVQGAQLCKLRHGMGNAPRPPTGFLPPVPRA